MKTFFGRLMLAWSVATGAVAADVPEKPRQAQQAQMPERRPEEPKHLLDTPSAGVAAPARDKLSAREAGRIAQATGTVLSQGHYRQEPLNNAISRTFFTNYLASLDYARMIFTQEDVDGFAAKYLESLDDLTRAGDASPAYEIFRRYVERLEERTAYALGQLEKPVDLAADERFNPQRDKLPWPRDRAAAEEVWRLRVKFDVLQGRLAKDKTEDVIKNLTKRYSRMLKTMKEFDDEEILSAYLTALAHAYDPHSDYMSPSEAKQFEISNVKLSLSGIGALLEWEDGYTRIKSLVPGGPAEQCKQLKPKDRVVAVAQGDEEPVDVVEMRLNKVVELIRGKKGSEVRLTVVPADSEDGSRKIVRLVRDDIKLSEQLAKARIVDLPVGQRTVPLGIIMLPQFYENCAGDVEKLIVRLKQEKVEGLVLDLRRNGGGILEEAIELTGLFVREGPVVQVKNQQGLSRILSDESSKVVWDGPLIVATGHFSASASEIVAAALQDYGRAVVVGDAATHGKGTVQSLVPLSQFFSRLALNANAGKLKFTVSKFYRIAGGTTQKYGVTPDIALPSVLDTMELGEAHLPNALPADRTTPADYERADLVQPYLPALRDRSANRVAASREFAFVLEDIEEAKKRKADPSVSLNEAKRVAEKAERKARDEARKKERRELEAVPPMVRELTLEAIAKGEGPKAVTAKDAKDAAGAPVKDEDKDEETEELTDEDERRLDPQLRETLNILGDYLEQMTARGERLAVDVRAAASTKPAGKARAVGAN